MLIFVAIILGTFSVSSACTNATPYQLLTEGLKATQSSLGWKGIPFRAIDGNFATDYGEQSCTHTLKQPENWWMVDLGKSYRVKEVKIYNRADCCKDRLNGATVRVGDNANGMLTNAVCGEPIKVGTSSVIIRKCTLEGQYVSVSLKNQYLTLCEVEVFGEELLTKGLKATQSSLGWKGIPVRAIDGNFDTNNNEQSCTHTQKQPENWWMVDLGKSYRVKEVKIYNRADCCKDRLNGATVRVGDNAMGMMTNAVCGEPIKVGTSSVIDRKCTLKGQYVSVSLKNQYLTLCEVEVWGEGL